MRTLDLGFMALTDAAPLIVASARGFFKAEGLRVNLHREVSWATIRDKVAAGLYEGAHMLAPSVLALNLGAGSEPADVIAPLSLNAHGAAIGVSRALADEIENAGGLAQAAKARAARGAPALSFAVVFTYSMHNYMLRAWAAAAGLDPDCDMRITIAPPTAIANRLRAGEIDGFCVGAPWGALCEQESEARIVLDSGAFWRGGPDKTLGLNGAWAAREPEAALALTRAVLRASVWADEPENAPDLLRLLAAPEHVGAPEELLARRLGQDETSIRFARDGAAAPRTAHACWILSQMLGWRHLDPHADFERALQAYRPDIFARVARDVGLDHGPESVRPPAGEPDAVLDLGALKRAAAALAGG